MKKNGYEFYITGEIKPVKHGLVDYIAKGYLLRDNEKIPCEVGYISYADDSSVIGIDRMKSHIFIKEGITDNGTHYNAETIELF